MSEQRVPSWFTALGFGTSGESIYDLFSDVLQNLPMSFSELARRLDVSQPAVSRWSSRTTHPSLEQMEATLGVLQNRLLEIQDLVAQAREVFDLVDRALLMSECQCVPLYVFCDTCSLRSTGVQDQLRDIQSRMAELLQEASAGRNAREEAASASGGPESQPPSPGLM